MRSLLILSVLVMALALGACGGEGGFCVEACKDLKADLEYQMPDLELSCQDSDWQNAGSCRECLDVLFEKTAASPVDEDEFCRRYWGE